MTNPAGKTVLVTGAGGGFGRHMVRQFREAGAKLILTDLSADALREAVADAGDELVLSIAVDLAVEGGSRTVVEACTARDIFPDILVNNAGIASAGRMDHMPDEHLETLMQLNLLAPMRLCRQLLPDMIERGSGHIVNISSVAGWIGALGMAPYCASKFGLRGFGESLANDLKGTGVNVTNIYPCFSRTPIIDSPQYGYEERRVVPDYLISDPANVVAHIIKGIRRNRLHVYPDRYARALQYIARFVPWLVPILDRHMQAQAIETGRTGAT